MRIIRAAERFQFENDWLFATWLFSFDNYYDPGNLQFGPLRVFNHDRIAGGAGFPTHPHREMEIVTYVLEGELFHRDSTGGEGVIRAGEVQRMTAGTGISHAEMNAHPTNPAWALQIWVLPDRSRLTPSYEQKQFTVDDRTGRLLPIASGQGVPGAVWINQDATFYVARLGENARVEHELKPGRRAFLYLIDGEISLGDEILQTGDQARLVEPARLDITGKQVSELILIDLP
jgi:redox-sensitive bicupin YhaK (pirin superfamily)